ncbi:hypothetical protein NLC26_03305 [Candidatus Aminicenantes bacterium AC-708-M15]|jgi:hypothetical protein|nr:hypothetical protein [Candidatus Aminicenantes bacterium AC-708-M15]
MIDKLNLRKIFKGFIFGRNSIFFQISEKKFNKFILPKKCHPLIIFKKI